MYARDELIKALKKNGTYDEKIPKAVFYLIGVCVLTLFILILMTK